MYRPPGGNVQAAIGKLENIVTTIRQTCLGDTLIIGDFNVDVLTDNVQSRKILQFASNCQVEQLIKVPTRVSDKTKSLLIMFIQIRRIAP